MTETYIYQNAFTSDIPWLAAARGDAAPDRRHVAIAAAFLVVRAGLAAAEGGMILERARHGSCASVVLLAFTLVALLPVYVMLSAVVRTQGDFLDHPLGFADLAARWHGYRTALNDQFPRGC